MKNKPKIVFFGTPEFAENILKELINSKKYKPVLVVTAPDRPVGRKQELTPPPVKVLAQKHKLSVFQPERLNENAKSEIEKTEPDLFVVAAYGKILPRELLNTPKHGALNVHPSLLPKWRGPSPVHYALLHGDTVTGNTIILLDDKMDHGPIIAQEEFKITNSETTKDLSEKLSKHGAKVLLKTIPDWIDGEITAIEQDHNNATYTKIITREDGRADWHESAFALDRKLRAFTPWPGLFTYWEEKRLKILSLSTAGTEDREEKNPGKVLPHKEVFAIQTGKGLAVPDEVQLEGEKPLSAKEFLKRHPNIIDAQLI